MRFSAFGEIQSFGTGDVPEQPGEEHHVERDFREFSSLGEILPVIQLSPLNLADVTMYQDLASGRAVGGNFGIFKLAAAKGWLSNDAAGYAQYLAYNSIGQADARFKAFPEYLGWANAATDQNPLLAHQSNSLSPLWTPALLSARGVRDIRTLAQIHSWTLAQEKVALDSFAAELSRVASQWGFQGALPTIETSGERIKGMRGEWLYKGTDYSRYTTDAYGNITLYDLQGRPGLTFGTGPGGIDPSEAARTAAAIEATYTPGVWIMVTSAAPPSPGDAANFAVLAWRPILQSPQYGFKGSGPWVKGSGFVHRTTNPQVLFTTLEDARYDLSNALYDNASLQAAIRAAGAGSPLPGLATDSVSDPTKFYAPVPSGTLPTKDPFAVTGVPKPPAVTGVPKPPAVPPGATVNPWTDVAVPTVGQPVPERVVANFATDSLRDAAPVAVAPRAPPAPAFGYASVALAAAAVWFLTRKGR